MTLYLQVEEVVIQLLGTVEIKWLKLAGCCKLAGGNDRNCMSTLTLTDQPVRHWSVCFFFSFCLFVLIVFTQRIILNLPQMFKSALLKRFLSVSELGQAGSPKHFSLKVLQNFIPICLIYFTFSFVDIYANMFLFRVKPYLCYPLDSGML